MANPTGTINADEAHSTRRLTGLPTPTVSDEAATKAYADSIAGGGVNSFGTIVVAGQSNVVADAAPDTLTLVAGTNVTLTTNASTDTVTIAATGTGTVTTTGSPATGNLTKFSGATSITNGDLSGDVATIGTLATTIANNAVTLGKMATMATDSILGRATASTGNVEVLTALPFAFGGDVTRPADSNVTTIANNAVSYAKIQDVAAASKLLGRGSASGAGDPQEITLGTNLSMSGTTLNSSAGSTNAFGTISVSGQSDVVADTSPDTLTLVAGSNVTLTTNASTDTITIAATGAGTIASTSDVLKGDGAGNAVASKILAHTNDYTYANNTASAQTTFGIYNTTAGSGSSAGLDVSSDTAGVGLTAYSSTFGVSGIRQVNDSELLASGRLLLSSGSAPIIFSTDASNTESARIDTGRMDVTTGFRIGGAAGSNKILKGNGTNFVASTETYATPGTSGNVMTSDGTNWTSAAPAGGGGGGTTVKVAGSNFTTTSLTLVDITGLTFAASSGVTYEVECTLYGGSADTAGLRIGIAYSGTHSSTEQYMVIGPTTTTGVSLLTATLGTLTVGGLSSGSQTAIPFKVWAVIHTTGTGNITVQVAKNTSGTATIIIGSRMTVTVL